MTRASATVSAVDKLPKPFAQLTRRRTVVEEHGRGVSVEAGLSPGDRGFHHLHHGLVFLLRIIGVEDGFALKAGGPFDGPLVCPVPLEAIVVLAGVKAFPGRGGPVIAKSNVATRDRTSRKPR